MTLLCWMLTERTFISVIMFSSRRPELSALCFRQALLMLREAPQLMAGFRWRSHCSEQPWASHTVSLPFVLPLLYIRVHTELRERVLHPST